MSRYESPRELQEASLTHNQARLLLWAAGNAILADESTTYRESVVAGQYIGEIFDMLEMREQSARTLAQSDEPLGAFPLEHVLRASQTGIQLDYGRPELADTEAPFAPVDVMDAITAQEVMDRVDNLMLQAHAQGQ